MVASGLMFNVLFEGLERTEQDMPAPGWLPRARAGDRRALRVIYEQNGVSRAARN